MPEYFWGGGGFTDQPSPFNCNKQITKVNPTVLLNAELANPYSY